MGHHPSDGTRSINSGLITPPSSPTKFTLLHCLPEGSLTLQVPDSLRKSRSCFLPLARYPLTPPASPITFEDDDSPKSQSPIPSPLAKDADPSQTYPHVDGSTDQPPSTPGWNRRTRQLDAGGFYRFQHSQLSPEMTARDQTSSFVTDSMVTASEVDPGATPSKEQSQEAKDATESPRSKGCSRESFSTGLSPSISISRTSDSVPQEPHEIDSQLSGLPTSLNTGSKAILTTSLERERDGLTKLPIRLSSSPLRPGQRIARGGSLSPTRTMSRVPDRFIPRRRPPCTTRESFELNRPVNRLTPSERITRDGVASPDPFSGRLRRSDRVQNELGALRETHSIIASRTLIHRQAAGLSLRRTSLPDSPRRVSAGAVWNVGGSSAVSDTVVGVSTGRGGLLGSGTNAPLYTSMFLNGHDPEAEMETYERRLALAFDVDQSSRILGETSPPHEPTCPAWTTGLHHTGLEAGKLPNKHVWRDNGWSKDGASPFLDAPHLRDDFYCSLLAYSHTAKCLAVGLGNFVHLWSETKGVDSPESLNSIPSSISPDAAQHVTSLAFSSTQGGRAILAVGRADGRIVLWSPFDPEPRFDAIQPKPVSCVSFRPTIVKRPSLRDPALTVDTEELLVGDEAGHIYFYSVEWPAEADSALFDWYGAMTLVATLTTHTQQICGLSWSADGESFATGGNDNICFLHETKKLLRRHGLEGNSNAPIMRVGPNGEIIYTIEAGHSSISSIEAGREKHKWELNAAVKAIAFCPWQRGLLAIGGGSNDRCIHFYHTVSGACLATIDCAAQVTSLIWSSTRREIAATFGFAQPEHPFRIAVFSWPSCEQIVAIPWYDENRALYAVAYPGGPNTGRGSGEDGIWWSRTSEEGCVVVAASDMAIRFHEIWCEGKRAKGGSIGLLGGSEILENLHGIDKDDSLTIR